MLLSTAAWLVFGNNAIRGAEGGTGHGAAVWVTRCCAVVVREEAAGALLCLVEPSMVVVYWRASDR